MSKAAVQLGGADWSFGPVIHPEFASRPMQDVPALESRSLRLCLSRRMHCPFLGAPLGIPSK